MLFFFFKQKTAYEIAQCLVGSEMCIRDSQGLLGYLVGSYDYDMLHDVMANISVGNGGIAYMTDPEGNIIADKDLDAMETARNLFDIYDNPASSHP